MAGNAKMKKILQPYGDMMQQLAIRIQEDLKRKPNAELACIIQACDSVDSSSYGRSILRVMHTLRELAFYEQEQRKPTYKRRIRP